MLVLFGAKVTRLCLADPVFPLWPGLYPDDITCIQNGDANLSYKLMHVLEGFAVYRD